MSKYQTVNGKLVKVIKSPMKAIKPVTVKFIAYRHTQLDKPEVVACEVTLTEMGNDRKSLLKAIATKEWLHDAPVGLIAEYLVGTNTYAMVTGMETREMAFEVNFYEQDRDNPAQHSCREIMALPATQYPARLTEVKAALSGNDYSVKSYA